QLEEAAGAAHSCRGAPGRFERVPIDAPFTVIVDSAVTPDALENLLQAARPLAAGSLAVLFGCVGERDREKRPLMGAVAEKLADRLILSNDNPRREDPHFILAQIAAGLKGAVPTATIADRREAIHRLLDEGKPGDVLVIAGKGGETYLDIGGVKHPFEDTRVVREWARLRGKEGPALQAHSNR
ncbi:MAG: glutamate ligase domain-containing protein, partial [Nitrospinaceae bacterium]